MTHPQKVMLFFNPKSGHSKPDRHPDLINQHFSNHNIELETVIVPEDHETLNTIINQAINKGVELFLAAGGDGTISMIGTHLIGQVIPLGIIPLGTGNLLAKALDIPLKIDQALDLITSNNHTKVKIDTFQLDERYFLLNISVGVSPQVMRAVDSDQKRHFGFFAYLINFTLQVLGLKMHRVNIDCDHQEISVLASEVLITNIGTAGIDPLTWSEDISLNDGVMDLLIIRAANIWDILDMLVSIFAKKGKFNPVIKFMQIKEYCWVSANTPLFTQADGDVVGETPFTIKIYPGSLTLIAGKNHHANHQKGHEHEDI